MNSRFKALTVTLMIAPLAAAIAHASTTSYTQAQVEPGSVLSLEQCRAMAMDNNKLLRRMAIDIKAARYRKERPVELIECEGDQIRVEKTL